jgi:hypothetical protein
MSEDNGYEVIPDDDPLLVGDADDDATSETQEEGQEEGQEADGSAAESGQEKDASAVDAKQDERDQFIPRARYDETHSKFKQAEERIKTLEDELAAKSAPVQEQQQSDVPASLKEMKKEAIRLLLDGEDDAAAEMEMKIFQAQQDAFDKRVEEATSRKLAERDQAKEAKRSGDVFQQAVADIVGAYPELDSALPTANADAIEMVVSLRDKYIAEGSAPADALKAASDKVVKAFGFGTETQPTDNRTRAAVKRNAGEAARQPALVEGGMGNRATNSLRGVPNDPREWAKLPKEEQDRLLQ